MGKTVDWSDSVSHVFPPGTSVEAHPRLSDSLEGPPATKAEASAKVKGDGTVEFKGLKVPHGPYWCVGRPLESVPGGEPQKRLRSLAFTANDENDLPEASDRVSRHETNLQTQREAEARATVAARTPEAVGFRVPEPDKAVTGARNTVNTHMAQSDVAVDHGPGASNTVKQEDVKENVPQRSSTPAGEATPIPKDELPDPPKKTSSPKSAKSASKPKKDDKRAAKRPNR